MKRYLLFCMESYYPDGGWGDFCGAFDTLDEAQAQVCREWWHIVDTETMRETAYGRTPRSAT